MRAAVPTRGYGVSLADCWLLLFSCWEPASIARRASGALIRISTSDLPCSDPVRWFTGLHDHEDEDEAETPSVASPACSPLASPVRTSSGSFRVGAHVPQHTRVVAPDGSCAFAIAEATELHQLGPSYLDDPLPGGARLATESPPLPRYSKASIRLTGDEPPWRSTFAQVRNSRRVSIEVPGDVESLPERRSRFAYPTPPENRLRRSNAHSERGSRCIEAGGVGLRLAKEEEEARRASCIDGQAMRLAKEGEEVRVASIICIINGETIRRKPTTFACEESNSQGDTEDEEYDYRLAVAV